MTGRRKKTAIGHFLDSLDSNDIDYTEEVESTKDKTSANATIDQKEEIFSHTALETPKSKLLFETPSGKQISLSPRLVDPSECKVWSKNARLQDLLTDENTSELRDRIRTQGQLVPILLRPSKEKNYKYEVIYGSRRLFVCKSLNIKVKALIGNFEDYDSLLFMDAENSGRSSPSTYEMGAAYKAWLKEGLFANQGDIAQKFGVTREWINRVIRISELPIEIIKAFRTPGDIPINKALQLASSYQKLTAKEQEKITASAKGLWGKGLDYKEVLKELGITQRQVKANSFISSKKTLQNPSGKKVCDVVTKNNGQVSIVLEKNLHHKDVEHLLMQLEKAALEI